MQPAYQTKNGQIFDNSSDAQKAEDEEFQAWLSLTPTIGVNDFLAQANNDSDGYDPSDYERALDLIRTYWSQSV
jgi:hypothetical protein